MFGCFWKNFRSYKVSTPKSAGLGEITGTMSTTGDLLANGMEIFGGDGVVGILSENLFETTNRGVRIVHSIVANAFEGQQLQITGKLLLEVFILFSGIRKAFGAKIGVGHDASRLQVFWI